MEDGTCSVDNLYSGDIEHSHKLMGEKWLNFFKRESKEYKKQEKSWITSEVIRMGLFPKQEAKCKLKQQRGIILYPLDCKHFEVRQPQRLGIMWNNDICMLSRREILYRHIIK